ncbi:MAG TPA: M3 family metallopeptidase [Solirubrobacteraceae bacterium]|nr:M3 family metallopeptidase [Solirubrobacteraceae bacterium]
MSDLTDAPDLDRDAAVWDLEPVVDHRGEAGARALLKEARARAGTFKAEFAGRVAELDVDSLARAAGEVDEIRELLWRAGGYARLRGYADSSDGPAGALRGAAETAQAEIDADLLFFELEWIALDEDHVEALLAGAGDRLDFAAHHLRRVRSRRPHLLDPEPERVLAETSVQRLWAWKRLYADSAARLTVELDGQTLPMTQALSWLSSPVRQERLQAMAAIAEGVAHDLPTRVAAYNQVLGEKAVQDRLRGYPTWLSSRNLANETSDAAVDALLAAVGERHELPRRWYRLKARLLGLERLASCDLRAPLPTVTRSVPYSESREVITSAWSRFSPRAGAIMEVFFTEGLIDAPIRAGKQSGALCAEAGVSSHPYVLLNYDSRPEDTMALAHELGHALHFELARSQRALQCESSIPMAEVASTFSEALIAQQLMARAADDRERLALLAARLDDAMGNVFMAHAYLVAEAGMHRARREQGELSAEELTEIWSAALRDLWQDTVELDDGMRLLWSLIPHMILEPGYLYSYAYGLLTAWSAFVRHQEVGEPFAEDYLSMLAAGGSRSPEKLVAMIGLDLTDPGFWDAGLSLLERMLSEADALAAAAG